MTGPEERVRKETAKRALREMSEAIKEATNANQGFGGVNAKHLLKWQFFIKYNNSQSELLFNIRQRMPQRGDWTSRYKDQEWKGIMEGNA